MGKKLKEERGVIGELCTKCKIGVMIHNALYTWKCNECGYQYRIDPNSPKFSKSVVEKFINED